MNKTVVNTFAIICLLLFIASCSTTKNTRELNTTTVSKPDTLRIANDSLSYEIIILEIGFTNWLVTQPPESYYTTTFLERKNRFYVAEFNRRVLDINRSRDLYPQQINYEFNVHYGKEVNYLLYNYFVYFEEKYNQKL